VSVGGDHEQNISLTEKESIDNNLSDDLTSEKICHFHFQTKNRMSLLELHAPINTA
jgi:hypothetical protein